MCNFVLKCVLLYTLWEIASCDICASVYPRAADFRLTNFTKSPFYLIQSDNFYNDDQPVLVEIGGSSFRGFLLAAVDPLTGRRIGGFVETQGIFTLPCSAAIHSDYHLKKHALLMWRPPRHSKGFVAFEITLMDELGRFLVGQISILPHQLFTHLQMIPIYTRAPSPQLSSSYPVSSVNSFPESLSSSSSSSSSEAEGSYRFVPILIPNLSQPKVSFAANNAMDSYLSAESGVHSHSLLPESGRKTPLPCSEQQQPPSTPNQTTQQHSLSSSPNKSAPQLEVDSQSPPFNHQLLGKLLHSIASSGQQQNNKK